MISALLLSAFHVTDGASHVVQIAPGVTMPMVNLGGVPDKPSNHTAWLSDSVAGRGVDTALTYNTCQKEAGDAVKNSALHRSEIFVTTKVPCCMSDWSGFDQYWCSSHKETSFSQSMDDAFTQVGLPTVDLLLLHWGCANFDDTVAAYKVLEQALRQNKTRAIGVSNFNTSALDALYKAVDVKPAVNQIQFGVANQDGSAHPIDFGDATTLKRSKELGVTLQAYAPFTGNGKSSLLSDPTVTKIAKAHGKSTAQVALRWLTQQGIPLVTATSNADHMKSDLDIFDFDLDSSEMDQLSALPSDLFVV